MGGRFSSKGGQIALGGVLAAGALVMLWLAGVAPSGQLGLTAVGQMAGTALLFLVFLGVYPVAKGGIESLRRLPLEWALKLIFFNLALTLCWFLFRELLWPEPPAWVAGGLPVVYGAGNLVFIIYDIGLSRLVGMLRARLGARRRG